MVWLAAKSLRAATSNRRLIRSQICRIVVSCVGCLREGLISLASRILGLLDEGLALIDETIGRINTNGDTTFMPELLRLKGGLLLSKPRPRVADAELCFAQSFELSRQQGARAWELGNAIDLAALYASQGR